MINTKKARLLSRIKIIENHIRELEDERAFYKERSRYFYKINDKMNASFFAQEESRVLNIIAKQRLYERYNEALLDWEDYKQSIAIVIIALIPVIMIEIILFIGFMSL